MKKNIFKRIGLIACALAVAITSIFAGVQKNGHNTANANQTNTNYSFVGSDIYIPMNRIDLVYVQSGGTTSNPGDYVIHHTLTDFYDFGLINFSFYFNNDSDLVLTIGGNGFYMQDSSNSNWVGSSLAFDSQATTMTIDSSLVVDSYYRTVFYFFNRLGASDHLFYTYINSSDFIPDIYKVELSSDYFTLSNLYGNSPSSSTSFLCNYVRYYDANNNYIEFLFPLNSRNYTSYIFDNRTYFLGSDLTNNQIYNEGYANGLADNQQNIYNEGFNAGQTLGYNNGFDDGVDSTEVFSFTSLFSSVLEVPVKTFSGLFNFEILGVNLLDFFLGLLTFSLIIYVLRLLIGG